MEALALAAPFVGGLLELAVKEVNNISSVKDKMEYLAKKVELLEKRASDVLNQVELQESIRDRKRKGEIEYWLKNVDEKRKECEKLNKDVQKGKFYAKRKLGKEIVKKVQEVIELDQQSTSFGELVLEAVEPEKVPLVTSTSALQGHAFQQNLGNVWKHVMDDDASSIGIYGMGGVGKTTLAMQVHNDLLRDAKFGGRVYWVTSSQECTVSKLQKDIAKAMKIDISDMDDEKKKAGKLCTELKKKHNFVLIIDDVWEDFDVEQIGIPCGVGVGKLIVTSRSEKICHRMGCEKVIKVEPLSEVEAWELFQEKLKLQPTPLELSSEVRKTAREGLPLEIVAMARRMRGRTDIRDWRNAFVELKKSLKEHSDITNEVFTVLLYSFNHLKDPILQNCFLYCSLYPEDHKIPRDELVRKFILEGILGKGNIRKAELNQGNAILDKLEDVSLLVAVTDGEGNKCVRMHDLVRDMALRITRGNPRFMVKSGLQLQKIPSEDEWTEDLNKVSLMSNEISTIPDGMSPMCPNLTSLNLSYNLSLVSIPDSFFEHMQSLQTLDLGNCRKLVSLPSLENLKALRELDLTWTESFCDEIGGLESLINLKCLELEGSSMQMMPSGTLCRLSHLQRLNLPRRDCVEVEAVKSLTRIEEFGCRFANMDVLRQFLKSRNSRSQLISYDIQVGRVYEEPIFATKYTKSIIINCNEVNGEVVIGDDVVLLLRDTKKLTLQGNRSNISKCILRVREDREQNPNGSPFESLEELKLVFLEELRNIIEVEGGADIIHPPPATFSSLKELHITDCPKMKKVLPRCFLDNLRNLEVLKVAYCPKMEEIIGEENEGEENNMGFDSTTTNHVPTLPNLRVLFLWHLSELKSIWKSNVTYNFIQKIVILGCTKLKKMPLFVPHLINGQLYPPPALQMIRTERKWWDSLEWDHPQHKDFFQPFVKFLE